VKKNTTIAVSEDARNKLLKIIHDLEDKDKKRKGYSDAILFLIECYKRDRK